MFKNKWLLYDGRGQSYGVILYGRLFLQVFDAMMEKYTLIFIYNGAYLYKGCFLSKRCRLPEVLADSHCFFGTERQSMLWPCPRFDEETMQYRAVSLWFWYDSASLFAVFGILFHEKTRQSYTSEGREDNPTSYPTSYPTPHPSPETASKYRMFGRLV